MKKKIVTELYNDNFQNYKRYNIPKAQNEMLNFKKEDDIEQLTLL